MPTTRLMTIAGVDVTARVTGGTLDISKGGANLDRLRCELLCDDGYRPAIDAEVIYEENAVREFGGFLDTPEERSVAGTHPTFVTEITATSFRAIASFRYVSETIPAGTMKSQVEYIRSRYLNQFSVTLDAGQVDGPDMPERVVTDMLVADVLTAIGNDAPGYVWNIDNYKVLSLVLPSANPSPWDLTDSNKTSVLIGDVVVTPTRQDKFANTLLLDVTGAGPATATSLFTAADGVSSGGFTRFEAKYPASDNIDDLWTNLLRFDGAVVGVITFDINDLISNGGSFAWGWDHASSPAALVFDEAAIPRGDPYPTGGQVIDYSYAIKYPFRRTATNAATPAAVREARVSIAQALSIEAADLALAAELARRSTLLRQVVYKTDQAGLEVGMLQHITIASRNIDADFLIQLIGAKDEGDEILTRSITAIETDLSQPSWKDTWREMFADSTGAGVSTSASIAAPAASGLLKFVSVPISDTECKALGDGSMTAIQASASPKRIKLAHGVLRAKIAVAYTNLNADARMVMTCGGKVMATVLVNDTGASVTDLTDVLTTVGEKSPDFPVPQMRVAGGLVLGPAYADMAAPSDLVATPILIALDNGGDGALTGGDGANALTLDLWYVEEMMSVPATIPAGVLAFSGYGDTPMKFLSADGATAYTAASNPQLGTGGLEGLVALDDGRFCVTGMSGVSPNFECAAMYDADLSAILGFDTVNSRSIACDNSNHYYGIQGNGVSISRINKYDSTGLVSNWDISGGTLGLTAQVLGMAADESAAYVAARSGANLDKVYKWSLSGTPSESLFATESGYKIQEWGILVLRSGDVLVAWIDTTPGGGDGFVKHYNSSGALLYTYALPGTRPAPIILTPGADDTSFWVSIGDAGAATYSGATIAEIETVSGSVLHQFSPDDGTFEFDGPFCVTRAPIAA